MELTGDSAELVECGSNCAVVVLELGTIHGGQQQMLGLGKRSPRSAASTPEAQQAPCVRGCRQER